MENRDNSFGMKYSILQKFGDTWSEWLQTDKEESAQQMVESMLARGREAQWVLIGQSATPEVQADLDRQLAQHNFEMNKLAMRLAEELKEEQN